MWSVWGNALELQPEAAQSRREEGHQEYDHSEELKASVAQTGQTIGLVLHQYLCKRGASAEEGSPGNSPRERLQVTWKKVRCCGENFVLSDENTPSPGEACSGDASGPGRLVKNVVVRL